MLRFNYYHQPQGPSSISPPTMQHTEGPSVLDLALQCPVAVRSSSRPEGTKDLSPRWGINTGFSPVKPPWGTLEAMMEGYASGATTADPPEGCQNCQRRRLSCFSPWGFKNKHCLEMETEWHDLSRSHLIKIACHFLSLYSPSFGKWGPSVIKHLRELGIHYLSINSEGRSGDSTISNHFGEWSFDYHPADKIRKRSLNFIFVHISVLRVSMYKGFLFICGEGALLNLLCRKVCLLCDTGSALGIRNLSCPCAFLTEHKWCKVNVLFLINE